MDETVVDVGRASVDSAELVRVWTVSGMASGSMEVVNSWLGTGSPASVEEIVVDVG